MFRLQVIKELKGIILSPKFYATFAVSTVLIVLSTMTGIQEYKAAVSQFESSRSLNDQILAEATDFAGLTSSAHRPPDPLQIFSSGVHFDIGRLSTVSQWQDVKLRRSPYSDDPIFAIFRMLDFVFIVQIVLSLIAILFTYDSISGEKEQGTLRLTFANSVPRASYILSKFAGSWLGMVIPLVIPVSLAVLLVMVMGVPMGGGDWSRLGVILLASLLLFTFFMALGVLVSSLTRRSSTSFLVLLIAWVALVLVIPRAATMVAGQLVSVPTTAEVDGQKDQLSKEAMNAHIESMAETWRERSEAMEGMTQEESKAYRDANEWEWMTANDDSEKKMREEVAEQSRKIEEDLRNRQAAQRRLAFSISRVSPAAAYGLTTMQAAGTDLGIKDRFIDRVHGFRTNFVDFAEEKQRESGGRGGMNIEIGSGGFNVSTAKKDKELDLSEVPRIEEPRTSLQQATESVPLDFGIMILATILCYAGAFVAFRGYDVR